MNCRLFRGDKKRQRKIAGKAGSTCPPSAYQEEDYEEKKWFMGSGSTDNRNCMHRADFYFLRNREEQQEADTADRRGNDGSIGKPEA